MHQRREEREKAVQVLYQLDIAGGEWQDALQAVLDDDESPSLYLQGIVEDVVGHTFQIDRILRDSLKKWSLERISHVDRSILRLAVCELKIRSDVPPAVVINEAVELGKTYGTEKSGSFINGVLSNVMKQEA